MDHRGGLTASLNGGSGTDCAPPALRRHVIRLDPARTASRGRGEKPARYIGLELGAQRPVPGQGAVRWLPTYPDTYEIGLPNQGLQILYEILNERDDAVAERCTPWATSRPSCAARIPLFSVDTHRPGHEFDVLAFNLSAELTYTNLLNCVDLAGVRGRPSAGPRTRRRRRPLHLQPRAAGRLPRLRRAGRR